MSDQEHRPMIFIKKFETEYRVDAKTGVAKEVDWVEYGPIGSAQYLMVRARIKDLEPIPMQGKASSNPAVQMAHARWNLIKPKYDAWKAGQSAPVNGTPLAAWNGVSANQAEMLRMNGFDLLAEVRRRTQRLPVIMLSTRGSVEDRKRATRLGANAYLVKTEFHSESLLEVVRVTQNLVATTFQPFVLYTAAAIIYVLAAFAIDLVFRLIEGAYVRPPLGVVGRALRARQSRQIATIIERTKAGSLSTATVRTPK